MTEDNAVGRARAILAAALDGLQITPHQQHAAIGAMLIFAATQPPPAHDRVRDISSEVRAAPRHVGVA